MDSKRPEPVPLVGVSRRAGRYNYAVKPPEGTLPLAGGAPGRATRSLVLVAILAATLAACGDRDGSAPGSAAPPETAAVVAAQETAVVAAQQPEHTTASDSEPTTIPVPTAEPIAVPASTAPESTPVASNDPEQPSTAPRAAEPAPEAPTETDTSQGGVSESTVAAGDDPGQRSVALPAAKPVPEASAGADVSGGGVSTGGLRGPPPEPPPEGERVVSKGDRRGGGGVPYVWRDGDRIRRARLQADLVLQPSSDNRDDDVVVRDYGSNSIVERRTRHAGRAVLPVFRDEGGSLATLPGGVLVVLDPDWDQGRVNRFFSANGIKRSRVIQQAFADNAYLVETDPGFPSLELANELAELDGVVLSSPNWQTEITFR